MGSVEVWTKRIQPAGSLAFAFLNTGYAVPSVVSIRVADLGLWNPAGYNVTEAFDNIPMGVIKPSSVFKVSVNPTGVFFGIAIKL